MQAAPRIGSRAAYGRERRACRSAVTAGNDNESALPPARAPHDPVRNRLGTRAQRGGRTRGGSEDDVNRCPLEWEGKRQSRSARAAAANSRSDIRDQMQKHAGP
jgi:hypothetical protein